jgi:excisionase family DNA binding protein
MNENLPAFLKPARFAKEVDFQRSKIYDMLNSGELHGVKIGGNWRIPRTELDRFMEQARSQAE